MRSLGRWLLLVALLAAPAGAGAQQRPPRGTARVTYLSSGWVFIDAGLAEGLQRGSRAEIIRRGRTVAVLRVESLGNHQASCSVASRHAPPRVGDSVRFTPVAAPASRPAPPRVAKRPPPVVRTPAPTPTPVPKASSARDTAVRAAPPRPPGRATPAGPAPTRAPAARSRRDSAPAARVRAPAARRDSTPPRAPPAPASRRVVPPPPRKDSTPRSTPPAAVTAPAAASSAAPQHTREPSAATPAPGRGSAHITFLTTNSVYVSAGKGDGLAVGREVEVLHGGRAVAQLKVAYLSTHQSSCQVTSKTDSLRVGDTVRFTPVMPVGDSIVAAVAPAARQAVRRPRRSSAGRLRGRVSLYYLTVQQRDSFGGQFSQPSGNIRLTGSGLGGSAIGLMVDVRTRRLVQALPGSPTSVRNQTRVYQASAIFQAPGSPLRVATGRQYAPGITSVGLLDGASAQMAYGGWDYGLFAGLQPDFVNLGFSTDIAQLGGYVRRHSGPQSLQRWSMTVGASGSYFNGHTNREFLYLQANYLTRRFSVYAVQEVDYYRPWRRVNGEQALSPTSSFANLQFQLTDAVSLTAGLDNRRSVRLYRDVVNPLTEFDDTFRRGVWAGLTARVANHFRAAFDARTNNNGGTSGVANTYTLALGAERLTLLGASVRTRSTRYTTGIRQGWLNSVSVGLEPLGRGSLQLTSGWRSEHDSTSAPTLNVRWQSLDMDVSVARAVFIILSAYRERGGIEAHDLLYAGLSYRF